MTGKGKLKYVRQRDAMQCGVNTHPSTAAIGQWRLYV
jgi:hypothetical protein